jgi:hypothetical protein
MVVSARLASTGPVLESTLLWPLAVIVKRNNAERWIVVERSVCPRTERETR